MAYLRQAVALLLAAAPFSHRVHLAQKLPCATCHPGAATSKTAADNNLPDPAVCLGCHKDMQPAIKQPAPSLVTKFNHRVHLKLIEGGCSGCHRGLAKADVTGPEHFPRMPECLTCHNEIDPPFSCVKCHDENANLKPASHTPDYLDRHNRKGVITERQSCPVCHGKEFTCLGCH